MLNSCSKSKILKIRCPKQESIDSNHRLRSYGTFRRRCDQRLIRRFHCRDCDCTFSEATLTLEFRQKKRAINLPLFKQLCSNTSMRRSAVLIGIARKTVDRRLIYFEKVAIGFQAEMLANLPKVNDVHFDDMESSIHTKLKPVSMPLAVEHPTRLILAIGVASMPAKGNIAELSRRKYGKRLDERPKAWSSVLATVATISRADVKITSDQHKRYPFAIKKHLPNAIHRQVPSRKAIIAGQGEVKKGGKDPLFSLNHTAAMYRANVCRLIRRTWCTSKRQDKLLSHMNIYSMWHNENILAKSQKRPTQFPLDG